MKMGSLFDGAGTFPFASKLCGIDPKWASEIEKFPIQCTTSNIPEMKHLGDITKISGFDIEPVDVITFGSPCQDLSIAGKQAGLSGERSGLFMEAVRIIKEMMEATNGRCPRIAVWENVPGAFSSNKGDDFRIVLEELCKIKDRDTNVPRPPQAKWSDSGLIMGNGYSIGWRVFDAQFWGVPQRRRRIYLVADFGGECAGKILFERDGLSRSFAESRKTWKGITENTANCIDSTGKRDESATDGNGLREHEINIKIYPVENHPADSRVVINNDGCIQTLTTRMGTGGGNVPLLLLEIYAKGTRPHSSEEAQIWKKAEVSNTLNVNDVGESRANELVVYGVDTYNQVLTGQKAKTLLAGHQDADGLPCILFNLLQDAVPNEKVFPCLSTGNPKTGQANLAICYNIDSLSSNSMKSQNPKSGFHETDVHRTLDTLCENPVCNQGGTVICMATQQGGAEITNNLCPTITAAAGMSGNNQPVVCLCSELGQASRTGGHVYENLSGTLRANPGDNQPCVVYTIDRAAFNQGQNAKFGIGIDEDGIAHTLVSRGPGAVCYCIQGNCIDRSDTAGCNGKGWTEKKCYTLTTIDRPAVCYEKELEKKALECSNFIVRRITPKECARLQGMPDWWCDKIPHSESAEYKMWGNGMALPNCIYIMEGIAKVLRGES